MSENKRKVALFASNFGSFSQTFVYDEICHHKRYEAEVFCHRQHNLDRFDYRAVNRFLPAKNLMKRAESLLYQTTTFSPTYWKKIQSGKFDLIHAHFGLAGVYTLPYHFAFNIPLVITVHGYDVPVLMSNDRFKPKFLRYWLLSPLLFKRVSRFLAASEDLANLLLRLGVPEKKIKVWRLGVRIPPEPEKIIHDDLCRVLMIGRFVEKKGHIYGLKAFAELLHRGIDAQMTVVGDGPLRKKYKKVVSSHNIGDRVRFTGIISQEEVFEEIEKADILIAPSVISKKGDRDSGILVVKEANARCVPAIGTMHGGIPEIIDDNVTGFLVPERNIKSITDGLEKLITSPELRLTMGKAARVKMEKEYNIIRRVEVLEEYYDDVIAMYKNK